MSQIDDLISVKGFKILVAMPPKQEKIGNVYVPDSHKDKENTAAIYGNVLAMGPEAYMDKEKFPAGPRCAVGDWVLMKSFTGYRFRVGDQELRLVNDDSIDGVISDPRLIERA